jgi:glycosyltransferase involved in cell wall biosynthesis
MDQASPASAASRVGGKRLLIVFDVSFPFIKGGAQRRFYEVARVLVRRGWSVDWLTFKAWDGPDECLHEGIRYLGVRPAPDLYDDEGKRSQSEPLIFAWEVARRLPRLRGYDRVWVGQWPLLHVIPVLLFGFLIRKPVVLDWWEVWGYRLWTRYRKLSGFMGFMVEWLTLAVFARPHVVVTDTRLEEVRLRGMVGRRTRVECVSNGIPREEIGPVDPSAPRTADIVALGRLKEHKRVDLLLEALAILKERHGMEPSTEVIGDGPERERLEAQARGAGLSRVRFHGFIEDLHEVYRRAKGGRLCVITTQSGGAGNLTLLEAYGCGLPVVAFRIEEGIDPDLVSDGHSGLLVDPPTAEALAETLHALLTDPARLDVMRAHALERAAGLSWESVGLEYEALFESLPR